MNQSNFILLVIFCVCQVFLRSGNLCPGLFAASGCTIAFNIKDLAKYQNYHVSFDTVVGVKKNSTTLAEKYMAAVLTNFVLVRHGQRLFTYITRVNLFSLLCFVPSNLSHPSTTRISL